MGVAVKKPVPPWEGRNEGVVNLALASALRKDGRVRNKRAAYAALMRVVDLLEIQLPGALPRADDARLEGLERCMAALPQGVPKTVAESIIASVPIRKGNRGDEDDRWVVLQYLGVILSYR